MQPTAKLLASANCWLPNHLPVPCAANCIVEPRITYKDRIFTTGEVGWAGVGHVHGGAGQKKDFSAIIKAAQVGA